MTDLPEAASSTLTPDEITGSRVPPSPARSHRKRNPSGHRNWSLIAGVAAAAIILLSTFCRGLIEPDSPGAISLTQTLHAPSFAHLLGTDEFGRDEFSRVIAGLSWSLGVTSIAVAVSALIGTAIGLVGAGWPGWPRVLVRRTMDFGIAFPFLVIAVVIIVVVGHGFLALSLTLGVVSWPMFSRVTFAEGIAAAEQDYVLAARLMGVRPITRVIRHILPAIRGTIFVMLAFMFADLLLVEAALSFIGLGAPLGTPTWGNMLYESEQFLVTAPWLLAAPAVAIVVVVVTANLLGDGLATLGSGPRVAGTRRRLLQLRPTRRASVADAVGTNSDVEEGAWTS